MKRLRNITFVSALSLTAIVIYYSVRPASLVGQNDRGATVACQSQLRAMHKYFVFFMNKTSERVYPASWSELVECFKDDSQAIQGLRRILNCPNSTVEGPPMNLSDVQWRNEIESYVSYRLANKGMKSFVGRARVPLVIDRKGCHRGGGNVLFSDGAVEWWEAEKMEQLGW